jgi:hypothetical protein
MDRRFGPNSVSERQIATAQKKQTKQKSIE